MRFSTQLIALIGTGAAVPGWAQSGLADFACEVRVYSGALVSGLASGVPVTSNQTLILPGNPPRFTGIVTVRNHGHKAATVAVGFLTTVNGINQIGKTQTVTVAAGTEATLWFSGWDRAVDWKFPGQNALTATITTDFYKAEPELNENNNGCGLAFNVQTK